MKIKTALKSSCCKANVVLAGEPDFSETGNDDVCTVYYICEKCKQPCDTHAS